MIKKSQLKQLRALHLKKTRDEFSLFFAEGVKVVNEVLDSIPDQVDALYATEEFIDAHRKKIRSVPVVQVTGKELDQVSALHTPQQAMVVLRYFKKDDLRFDFKNNFSLYLDDIRDPGNFGTIIRLADWFGIDKIFCSENSVDIYNPKVIQASMGAFMRVRIVYSELSSVLTANKPQRVYGALLKGENLYREKLNGGLIVIGNEARGISDANIEKITHPITIPSSAGSGSESLNAAMATSIIVSEFFRQMKA